MEIKDLDVLLAPVLGKKQISSYTTRSLIGPGENYGSVMLALDVKLKCPGSDEEESLNLVAKMCPPTEFIKNLFNIPVTFKKEVGFYSVVVPTLQEFQRERGCKKVLDCFPKYYGSRISLDPNSDRVDDDACLLLENIKVKGYDIGDRITGFNLEAAKYILKDLARFHAVPIALKIADPKRFQEKIAPFLVRHVEKETLSNEMVEGLQQGILESAKKNKHCAQHVQKMKTRMEHNSATWRNLDYQEKEPFATITHGDYWVNNTMLKYNDNKIVGNAMVDFQLVTYANPMQDVLFFIYSSLSVDLITQHYKDLINLYHETFIGVLEELKIDTEPFNHEAFLGQLERAAKEIEFFHIMFMMKPIFTEKSKAKELSDINENEMMEVESVHENYYPKLWNAVLDFADRNWL